LVTDYIAATNALSDIVRLATIRNHSRLRGLVIVTPLLAPGAVLEAGSEAVPEAVPEAVSEAVSEAAPEVVPEAVLASEVVEETMAVVEGVAEAGIVTGELIRPVAGASKSVVVLDFVAYGS
jgi:hypothetical protein